jgi:hypothetical protein
MKEYEYKAPAKPALLYDGESGTKELTREGSYQQKFVS